MRRSAAILACWLALPAAAQAAGVTVENPWMRYLLPGLPAAGYMVLHNGGDVPVALIGAASPACEMLMLHRSQDSSGTSMMMDVPTVSVPAGGSVSFAPGGYHLMCMTPRMKVGDRIAVTLRFANAAPVSATMPVYGANGAP